MKAVYAYIPVIHSGVLVFLKRHSDKAIWLLDNEKGKEVNVYLERDIRALPAEEIQRELSVHDIEAEVVSHEELAQRAHTIEELIVPNDEIVKDIVERFAPNVTVKVADVFLRWTKPISSIEHEIPNGRQVTQDKFSQSLLADLEEEAKKSPDWWRQIGAALVKEGKVLVMTYNKHYPTQHSLTIDGDPRSNLNAGEGSGIYLSIHAEAWAIAEAAKKGIPTQGAEAYVTTFPCPSCARLLVEAGVKRLYYKKGYSLLDAEKILGDAGVEIVLVTE